MNLNVKVEPNTTVGEDFATFLVGDASFSDVASDDSSGWMHKIDVSNFKQLTSDVHQQFQYPYDPSAAVKCRPVVNNPNPNPQKRPRFDPEQHQDAILSPTVSSSTKIYPKPLYSYSCLIALSLKNSKHGRLQVSEIYSFMCENFPYFRTAPSGWKNSVRHNLSLNKCFEKIVVETGGGHGRKCCLWTLNPAKAAKMEQEIRKWREKDMQGVRDALFNPDDLDAIEMGFKGLPGDRRQAIVVQPLTDIVPITNIFPHHQTTGGYPTTTYYTSSSSCGTPPRHESFDMRFNAETCPPQLYSPPAFSTPIRRLASSSADSPHSLHAAYSPEPRSWHLDSTKMNSIHFYPPLTKAGGVFTYSPGGATSGQQWPTSNTKCPTAYESALAATDVNNSLLQTALAMSPAKVTLQSL